MQYHGVCVMDTCVVLVGDEENICGREGNNIYKSEIKLQDGRTVIQDLCVCDRHKQVFEEMWNDQGNYQ